MSLTFHGLIDAPAPHVVGIDTTATAHDYAAGTPEAARQVVGCVMTDERRFEELLAEFERVGVDLNSFPAGITLSRGDTMRIMSGLADGAGPAAFLARVREEQLIGHAHTDNDHIVVSD